MANWGVGDPMQTCGMSIATLMTSVPSRPVPVGSVGVSVFEQPSVEATKTREMQEHARRNIVRVVISTSQSGLILRPKERSGEGKRVRDLAPEDWRTWV